MMDRGTVEMALMSPQLARTGTVLWGSSSATMGTARVRTSCAIPSRIAVTDQMKILYFVVCSNK